MPPAAPSPSPPPTPPPAATPAAAPTTTPVLFTKPVGEGAIKTSWKCIKGITSYVSQLVRGTVSGAWEMTGGAALGLFTDTGHHIAGTIRSIGETAKETGACMDKQRNIGKVGSVINGIVRGTAHTVYNVMNWPIGLAQGIIEREFEGGSKIVDAAIMQYDKGKTQRAGGRTSTGGTPAPAAA